MITRIELDGFKSFQDFKLELAPFQAIIGANAVGKSNLFDALRLLSRFGETDLRTAILDPQGRGNPGELFTLLPDGRSAERMRLAVEMLLNPQPALKYTRLRYEVEISRAPDELGMPRLYRTHEYLGPIQPKKDGWAKRYIVADQAHWIPIAPARPRPFLQESEQPGIKPGHSLLEAAWSEEFHPYATATRAEMRSWQFLLELSPDALRQASPMLIDPILTAEGRGLPGVLARMQAQDSALVEDVSLNLSGMVSDIRRIEVQVDEVRQEYNLIAQDTNGRRFSARLLSDGTLRLLALSTIANDPQHRGSLCMEEPETGVHPFRVAALAHLLRNLATDFTDPAAKDYPLRQVLINTQSPALVGYLSKELGPAMSLAFAHTVTRLAGESPPMRVTHIVPVTDDRELQKALEIQDGESAYTLRQVQKYLSSVALPENDT